MSSAYTEHVQQIMATARTVAALAAVPADDAVDLQAQRALENAHQALMAALAFVDSRKPWEAGQ